MVGYNVEETEKKIVLGLPMLKFETSTKANELYCSFGATLRIYSNQLGIRTPQFDRDSQHNVSLL